MFKRLPDRWFVDFNAWKMEVSNIIRRRTGLSADDFPDWNYREAFDNRVKPPQAATRAINTFKKDMGI
jgi:hypothetical protein